MIAIASTKAGRIRATIIAITPSVHAFGLLVLTENNNDEKLSSFGHCRLVIQSSVHTAGIL